MALFFEPTRDEGEAFPDCSIRPALLRCIARDWQVIDVPGMECLTH